MWDLKFTNSAIHLLPCRYYAAGTQPVGMSSSSSFSSSIRFASCLKNSIFRLRGRRRGRNTIFNRQHASTGNCHPAIKNLCKVRKFSLALLSHRLSHGQLEFFFAKTSAEGCQCDSGGAGSRTRSIHFKADPLLASSARRNQKSAARNCGPAGVKRYPSSIPSEAGCLHSGRPARRFPETSGYRIARPFGRKVRSIRCKVRFRY